MTQCIIRAARREDAEAIAHVHVRAWQESYKGIVPQSYLDRLDVQKRIENHRQYIGGPSRYLVAEDRDEIVGFVIYGEDKKKSGKGEVHAIYLLDLAKGEGTGKALLREALDDLKKEYKEILVWVLKDNSAKHFYEKMGAQLLPEAITVEMEGKVLDEVCYGWLF